MLLIWISALPFFDLSDFVIQFNHIDVKNPFAIRHSSQTNEPSVGESLGRRNIASGEIGGFE